VHGKITAGHGKEVPGNGSNIGSYSLLPLIERRFGKSACLHGDALIGIDPDFRIHASDRLLELHDGPFLELGFKGIAGKLIDRPRRLEDRPNRDRLAIRFEQFKKAA
jgi:hypothetical protein